MKADLSVVATANGGNRQLLTDMVEVLRDVRAAGQVWPAPGVRMRRGVEGWKFKAMTNRTSNVGPRT